MFLNEADDYSKAYAGFAGEFICMLVFAAGLLGSRKSVGHDEMVAAIYLFHRKVSHSPDLRKTLADRFADSFLSYLLGALGEIK